MEALQELLPAFTLLAVCALCVFGVCYVIMGREARRLHISRQMLSDKTGAPFPVRFVLLSDLHFPLLPLSWEVILESIQSEDPAFIVITGDLCNNRSASSQLFSFLDRLATRVRRPIYITLGNHDLRDVVAGDSALKQEYIRLLQRIHPRIKVLDNEFCLLECDAYGGCVPLGVPLPGRETRRILLGGASDCRSDLEDKRPLVAAWQAKAKKEDAFFLLATHNADILLDLEDACCDALVAGHTHGGQIRFPFYLEFRLLRRKDRLARQGYAYGLHQYRKIPLYITSGLGCNAVPLRHRMPAEIAVLTI